MAFEIILSSEVVDDLRRLSAFERAKVCDAMEIHLRYEPTKVSRSRIKGLRGIDAPAMSAPRR
jgi:hypothetical protein